MLSAINSKKEIVLGFQLNEKEIENLKKENLKCACCDEIVRIRQGRKILKSGKIMVTHFSHKEDSDCPDPKESPQHIATKISIYKSIKNKEIL